jgi:hypothetical protein
MTKPLTITITIDEYSVRAAASILENAANTRLTKSGAVARSNKGEFKFRDDFRQMLVSVAEQMREQVTR